MAIDKIMDDVRRKANGFDVEYAQGLLGGK